MLQIHSFTDSEDTLGVINGVCINNDGTWSYQPQNTYRKSIYEWNSKEDNSLL